MPDARFLLVRLGSLGDIVHALPAASALRDTFPDARIDWVVDAKWTRLLERNPDISNVIVLDRKSAGGIRATVRKLHSAKYSCAIDFQALYKSALLPFWARVPRRIGFKSSYAREGLAALLYTETLNPRGPHKVDHNLALVEAAGARSSRVRFPLAIRPEDDETVSRVLAVHDLQEFFVLNPGGGWRSKCWPAERYGELHRRLYETRGWRGVLTFGPREQALAEEAKRAAGNSPLAPIELGLGPLMALLRRAKFVVSADTGPLHLASALGAPTIGLFGPTDPSRNGPFSPEDVSVRNPGVSVTTYRRGKDFAASMLSITVEQVVSAIDVRLARLRTCV
ncbi:MAG TPA: glycosyltransferase family 9 protein [Candidatus Acidoferrales bacterium]|nr:glycosyltransferase family 9 protein [Candidatus Acidoferrales bacterium]